MGILLFSGISISVLILALCLPRDVADTSFAPRWLSSEIRYATSQEYHEFADRRAFLGIPNFANVASNLPFLFFGLCGLCLTLQQRRGASDSRRGSQEQGSSAYALFFIGIFFTFFGSAYYHWASSSARLFWDRLPMTVAFMSILAATVGDRISPRIGAAFLAPLVALGVFSAYYLHITEGSGTPDARLYGVVQFYPLVAIPLLFTLFPARYTHSGYLLATGASYVVAKVFETFDRQILLSTGISGHSLKHVAAGAATFWVLVMLRRRVALIAPHTNGSASSPPFFPS